MRPLRPKASRRKQNLFDGRVFSTAWIGVAQTHNRAGLGSSFRPAKRTAPPPGSHPPPPAIPRQSRRLATPIQIAQYPQQQDDQENRHVNNAPRPCFSGSKIPSGERQRRGGRAPNHIGSPQVTRHIQTWRSTIIFLISAIAFAGFKPLGQVLVQFMIVWQRYSLNGSSRSSSRSPVASSRLSMIQR